MSKVQQPTEATVAPVTVAEIPTKPISIRQLVIGMIQEGHSTKVIAERIKAIHPTSMAAEKSTKHIAWYRAQLKKEGKLPSPVMGPIQLQA